MALILKMGTEAIKGLAIVGLELIGTHKPKNFHQGAKVSLKIYRSPSPQI